MLIVLFDLLLWMPAVWGWGGSVRYVLGQGETTPDEVGEMLLGIVALSMLAQVINFFLPLTVWISWSVLLFGWWGLAWRWRQGGIPMVTWGAGVGWVVTVIFGAAVVSQMSYSYDAGLYHLPTIQWLIENPTPLGLANLHGRLAFNSSWFALSALMRSPLAASENFATATQVLLAVYVWAVWRKSPNSLAHTFLRAGALSVLALPMRVNLSSPSSDLPVMLLTLLSTFFVLRSFEHDRADSIKLAWVSVTLAVTIKFSAAPLVFLPLGAQLAQREWREWRMWHVFSLLVPLVLVWVVRGVMLSGCLIYPLEFTCLPIGWRTPPAIVVDEARWIQAWARMPGLLPDVALANWNWMLPWSMRTLFAPDILLTIALFIGGAVLWSMGRYFTPAPLVWWVLGSLLIGIVFWFFTAPDIRFGAGYVWALALCMWSVGWCRVTEGRWRLAARRLVIGGVSLWVGALALLIVTFTGNFVQWREMTVAHLLLTRHTPLTVEVRAYTTTDGNQIFVPAQKDECWLAPVPCTPYFNNNLRLQTLADGRWMFWFDSYILESPERLTRQP